MQREVWSCGHEASASCAECHRLLTVKANVMVEIIDVLLDALRTADMPAEQRRKIADRNGARLNLALGVTR
jgi:hypothetical protein